MFVQEEPGLEIKADLDVAFDRVCSKRALAVVDDLTGGLASQVHDEFQREGKIGLAPILSEVARRVPEAIMDEPNGKHLSGTAKHIRNVIQTGPFENYHETCAERDPKHIFTSYLQLRQSGASEVQLKESKEEVIGSFKKALWADEIKLIVWDILKEIKLVKPMKDLESGFGEWIDGLGDEDFLKFAQAYDHFIKNEQGAFEEKKDGYIKKFIEMLEADPDIVFPVTAEWIYDRLRSCRMVVLDPIRELSEDENGGHYDTFTSEIKISLALIRNFSFPKLICHEFFHAVSGCSWTDDGTKDYWPTRTGLVFRPIFMLQFISGFWFSYPDNFEPVVQRLDWLDEAVTECLTLRATHFSRRNHFLCDNPRVMESDGYVSERKVLQKLLDIGVPLQLFVDAYFEIVSSSDPQKRMVAFRKLSACIRGKVGKPGSDGSDANWLVRVDQLYQGDHNAFEAFAESDAVWPRVL